jgi:uncharacterized membrane protein
LLNGLVFTHLTALPLENDEAFSYSLAMLPWGEAWSLAVADASHPPVFTMVLKTWIAIGDSSLLWVRMLPALSMCLLIAPFLLLADELAIPRSTTALALTALVANPTRMYYTHIVRSYGPFMLLSVTSMWLFARLTGGRRASRALTMAYWAVNVLLCCMHYFGVWVVGIQCLLAMFVYRNQIKRSLAGAGLFAATAASWAPGAWDAATARRGLSGFTGWMNLPRISDLVWFWHTFTGGPEIRHAASIGLLLFGWPVALWAIRGVYPWRGTDNPQIRKVLHLLPYVAIPLIGTFALSHLTRTPLFAERVLIFAVAPCCLMAALGVTSVPFHQLRTGLWCAFFVWTASSIALTASKQAETGVRWDLMAACVSEADPSSLPVRALDTWITRPYAVYLQMSDKAVNDIAAVSRFDSRLPDRFWAAYRVLRTNPDYSTRLQADLHAAGYETVRTCALGQNTDFLHVRFDLQSRTRETANAPGAHQ